MTPWLCSRWSRRKRKSIEPLPPCVFTDPPPKHMLPLHNGYANQSERNIKMGGELEKDLKPYRISKIIDNFADEYTN